jgi:uncharacterized protein YcfL
MQYVPSPPRWPAIARAKQSLAEHAAGLFLILLFAGLIGTLLFSQMALAQPSMASRIETLGILTHLEVTQMKAVRRDNLLRVQVEVTNTSHKNQQLFYRFKWLDADGFSAWDEGPWKPLTVNGLERKLFDGLSPTFDATDFRLQLQSPDNRGKPHFFNRDPYTGGY